MEIIFEVIVSFVWEVILQTVIEILVELGLHSVAEAFHRRPNPWFAAIGYFILGTIAGGVSILVFPTLLAHTPTIQWVNLILAPVAAGMIMAAMGAWRARRGDALIRLDKFAYGYLFALALAIVRFHFAG